MTLGLPCSPATRRALDEGIALFDAGRFFDAHEAWEDAWRDETGRTRILLQGLIQIAAGFHKGLVQGVPAGMARLLEAGLTKVDAAAGSGLAGLGPFRSDVLRWRAAARSWAGGGSRPVLSLPRLGALE